MAEIGGEIKRRREELDLSQPRLAVKAGVAVSAVSQIENGKRSPNLGTLEKIAGALGVEVVDLFPKAQAPLSLREASAAPFGGFFELPGLKAARKRLGWSQNELAAKANVPAADIPALEHGSLKADGETVARLARTLDCHKGDLFQPENMGAFRAREKEAERLLRLAESVDPETTEALRSVSPDGRMLADAIDAHNKQRAHEQPEAG